MKSCRHCFFLSLALAASPFFAAAQLLPFADPAETLIRSNRIREFSSRLESAVKRRDFVAIQDLYQTNGVASEELKLELARWRQLLDRHVGQQVSAWFKELDSLPSQARASWTQTARRLTDRDVDHVVSLFFPPNNWAELVVPLVLDSDRLRIVVSEKRNAVLGSELPPLRKWHGVTRSKTNSTSSTTGSRP